MKNVFLSKKYSGDTYYSVEFLFSSPGRRPWELWHGAASVVRQASIFCFFSRTKLGRKHY